MVYVCNQYELSLSTVVCLQFVVPVVETKYLMNRLVVCVVCCLCCVVFWQCVLLVRSVQFVGSVLLILLLPSHLTSKSYWCTEVECMWW